MNPFLGQIMMFGGDFAPRGWALCDGQLLPISQYTALFSILGTIYGGDGRTTFQLPDLRGRVPVHPGSGPGLSTYRLGEKGGAENVILNSQQMPTHNHGMTNANIQVGAEGKGVTKTDNPAGGYIGSIGGGFSTTPGSGNMSGTPNGPTDNSGGNQGHPNIQPFQCVNYIIALQGVFPSRS